MTTITIEPATADRAEDVQAALTGGGDGGSCQCQWYLLTSAVFNHTTRDQRRAMLNEELTRTPSPGLIAYVDGVAAGWVRVGPRNSQPRLARMRTITAATRVPMDHDDVWAVTCFSVRREFRSLGVTRALVRGAVDFATSQGARIIEGYPRDPHAAATTSNDMFHGSVSIFTDLGFSPIAPLGASSLLVELTVGGTRD